MQETDIELKEEIKLEKPKMYKVIILNDDHSTVDFVVEVLMNIFHKTFDEAYQIMLNIHNNGKEVCGVYVYEIAQTKVAQVQSMANNAGYPLTAVAQEE